MPQHQLSPSLAQVKSTFRLCQAVSDAQQFQELWSCPTPPPPELCQIQVTSTTG